MNASTQRACVWSGPLILVVFTLGFWVIAGLIPPPSASMTAPEIAHFYADNTMPIRIGLVISSFGAAMCYPWAGVLALQMRRVEGRWSPMALTELGSGIILGPIFMYPMVLMAVAAYRPLEIDPQVTQTLNDIAWLGFIWVGPPTALQAAAVGVVALRDKREEPVFPRWTGYFNLWCALLFLPGEACIFVKSGPLAWGGLFSFWIVLGAFAIWLAVMTRYLLRAIAQQEREPIEGPDPRTSAGASHGP